MRMEIEETVDAFIDIWTAVFVDACLDRATRSAKLEATIKGLLKRRGLPENQKLYSGDVEGGICKAYVASLSCFVKAD
jgi:hypothetical protein